MKHFEASPETQLFLSYLAIVVYHSQPNNSVQMCCLTFLWLHSKEKFQQKVAAYFHKKLMKVHWFHLGASKNVLRWFIGLKSLDFECVRERCTYAWVTMRFKGEIWERKFAWNFNFPSDTFLIYFSSEKKYCTPRHIVLSLTPSFHSTVKTFLLNIHKEYCFSLRKEFFPIFFFFRYIFSFSFFELQANAEVAKLQAINNVTFFWKGVVKTINNLSPWLSFISYKTF